MEGEGGAQGVNDLGVQCLTFVDLADKEYGGLDVGAADSAEVDEDPGDEEVRLGSLQPEQGNHVGVDDEGVEDDEGEHLDGLLHRVRAQPLLASNICLCLVPHSCPFLRLLGEERGNGVQCGEDVEDDQRGEEDVAECDALLQNHCHHFWKTRMF